MGRKKKTVEEFPSMPVPVADFILYHEMAIRQSVADARASVSFVRAARLDGKARGGSVSDRTAAQAIKNSMPLPCVVLDSGEKVENPEKWLAVLDAVRDKAKGCNNPKLILDIWAGRYHRGALFLGETRERTLSIRNTVGAIVSYIRYHVLVEGRQRGLVSFSDEYVMQCVEAAAG